MKNGGVDVIWFFCCPRQVTKARPPFSRQVTKAVEREKLAEGTEPLHYNHDNHYNQQQYDDSQRKQKELEEQVAELSKRPVSLGPAFPRSLMYM